MAEIRLVNLEKRFGDVVAVNNLNLTIKDGEFVTLLGPSGCGKTTTLNMIAGLVPITSGEIWIGGQEVGWMPPQQRDCAMVFQNYAIYPHMSVFENIAFPLQAKRLPQAEIRQKVENISQMLGIKNLLNRRPKELSGGQRQRVALGRAMVRQPKVFLMDEPLSNLDARLRLHMRFELRKLHEQSGATTIYVTHDQAEAMTLSDRIALMKDGVLQQFDTPRAIYSQPNNVFVASFMGDLPVNLFDAVIVRQNGKPQLQMLDRLLPLPPHLHAPTAELADGHTVKLGVRPEAVRVIPKTTDIAGRNGMSLEGQVDMVQELGATEVVYLKANDKEVLSVVEPNCGIYPRQYITIEFDPALVHLFDAKTEVAIR